MSAEGARGETSPYKQIFQIPAPGGFGKIGACEGTQAVLAILVQTARREFACCTSLGECLTTHKGVTARLL